MIGFCYLYSSIYLFQDWLILGVLRILDALEPFDKTGNDYRIKDWTMKFDDKIQENLGPVNQQ